MGADVGRGQEQPKTTQVVGLLSYYCHQIEADIARFYPGRRIGEWWRTEFGVGETMTSRELMVLVEQLPEESATKRAITGDDWTTLHHLVANIQDIANFTRADTTNYRGGSANPEPIKRPGQAKQAAEKQAAAHRNHDQIMATMGGKTAPN